MKVDKKKRVEELLHFLSVEVGTLYEHKNLTCPKCNKPCATQNGCARHIMEQINRYVPNRPLIRRYYYTLLALEENRLAANMLRDELVNLAQ